MYDRVHLFLGSPIIVFIPWFLKWLCWDANFEDHMRLGWRLCVPIQVLEMCVKEREKNI